MDKLFSIFVCWSFSTENTEYMYIYSYVYLIWEIEFSSLNMVKLCFMQDILSILLNTKFKEYQWDKKDNLYKQKFLD